LNVTPLQLAIAILVAIVAGIVRGFSGFGAGLILVPALALIAGARAAVPIAVLMDLVAGVRLVPAAFRQADLHRVGWLGAGAAVTIPLGAIVLATVDAQLLRQGIGILVLLFVALLSTGWRYRGTPGRLLTLAVGSSGGLLTGSAGVGGPPIILFFVARGRQASEIRASMICFLAISQAVAFTTHAFKGLVDAFVLWGSLLLILPFVAGTYIGSKLFGHVDERWFRRSLWLLLLLLGLAALLA
jgi:uncharacterized membrane protein YfcA